MDKKERRLRRSRRTRLKISSLDFCRLSVHRTNSHIYAQIYSVCGTKVLASASTVEAEIRKALDGSNGANVKAAGIVGQYIASRAKSAGVEQVAFDRSGFSYHGRIKALAESARQAGLNF
jgi:large subunit ribosomal protein L18